MNNKRNWGKEIKQVGVLIIVIGAAMLGSILFALSSSNNQSVLYKLVDKHFIFLIIGGLVSLLAGVIIRSIGKSKEAKFNAENSEK